MEENRPKKPIFENKMTSLQRTLGWIYLPLHAVVIPLLVLLYGSVKAPDWSAVSVNIVYYAIGILFVAAVMLRYLRGEFDTLLDRLPGCIITMLLAMLIMYALNTGATLILLLMEDVFVNPNTDAATTLAKESLGSARALSVFLAPLVEEVLFRGVLFGSLRERSRGWAYVVSAAVFSLYHVWQYAFVSGDLRMLLYAIQYIPISVVLAWCYERSGSLWTSVFYHMGYNAISFALLNMMM